MELKGKIDLNNAVLIPSVHTIAGVDLAYWKEEDVEYANCCIVVLDFSCSDSSAEKKIIIK